MFRIHMILAIFHLLVFVFANVWNIYYIIRWYQYVEDNAVFLLCVQIILDLGWFIAAIVYFRQRDNEKYRDDVEVDSSRKERSGIEKGILTGLVVLTVTVFIKAMVVNISDYVFHSRQAKDQGTIEDIQSCISAAYFAMNQNDALTLRSCESYIQMAGFKNPLLVDHGSQPSYEAGEK